ncbi:MAG: ATP-binding cassette domain-containing protein [Lachnospiraceae bacterium]|nr:ATP-binding cassette domain-containing protein [Lachnospiraceae bacterium]
MESYIEVTHVTKKFREDTVLYDINVSMERGKVYGFSGNNGSGKTVLMKCICGFLPVTEGSIRVNGKLIGREIDFPESIGVIIETPGFLTNLTGMRNLEILAGLRKKISRQQIRQAMEKAGLNPDLKKSVSKYSLGMRQRLGIAQAIMEDPEFLILDEPFNGLDKHGVADIRALLLDLKKQGKTIILASHNSEDIQILCDRVYEMDGGRMRQL